MKMDLNPEEELACAVFLKDEKYWKKVMSKFEVISYLDKKDFETVLFMASKYRNIHFSIYVVSRLNRVDSPEKYKNLWNTVLKGTGVSHEDIIECLKDIQLV